MAMHQSSWRKRVEGEGETGEEGRTFVIATPVKEIFNRVYVEVFSLESQYSSYLQPGAW